MPFKPDLDELYSQTIKPVVERTKVFECLRADEIYGPRPIMRDIWDSIQAAALIVADLTGRNPNVLYELGLAHAIQKPVVLLAQTIDDIPFDLKQVRILVYRNTTQGRQHLQNELAKTLRAFLTDSPSGTGLRSYRILEAPEAAEPSPRQRENALHALISKDPTRILGVLRRLAEAEREGRTHDPRVAAAVMPLLASQYLEVQREAIRALGAMKDRIHAPSLRQFLTSGNPVLVEASIDALGHLRDSSAVPRLLDLLSDPPTEACAEKVVTALGKIGGRAAVAVLAASLRSEGPASQHKETVIRALGEIDDDESLDPLLELDPAVLGTSERAALAEVLGASDAFYRLVTIKKLKRQLTTLLSDSSAEVRGVALGAWALQSFREFGGRLERTMLWTRLAKESEEVVSEFFLHLVQYRSVFSKDETAHVLRLAGQFPANRDACLHVLRDIGDASAAKFMLRTYRDSERDRLWVLDYLSRVPVRAAEGLLRTEIASGDDASRVTLAAIGLAKLTGDKDADAIEAIGANVFESYSWIRDKAKEYLTGRLKCEPSARTRRSLTDLLGRISRKRA
jgi:HEAT repeat protein